MKRQEQPDGEFPEGFCFGFLPLVYIQSGY